jgi:hypothetical protein
MHRKMSVVSAFVVVLVLAATAYAASVHFKNNREPTFKDNGLTATISGALAGLGNQDVTITVTAEGVGSSICKNPSGKIVPGQNKVPIETTASQTISASEIKNGTVSFSVTTATPPDPSAAEAGCPNNNWTAELKDVKFTSYTVTVVQGGKTVLTFSKEF